MTNSDRPESSQNTSDEPVPRSSLWQSAYEHRHQLATGVAEVSVGVAAAAALTALHLNGKGSEVLVVEAAPFMGKALRDTLQSAGHKVTWISEIKTLEPLVGVTESKKMLYLNPKRFGTAFIDPNHVSLDSVNFEQVAPFFKQARVRTIGTSAMGDVNEQMLASGFDLAGNKTAILTSLIGKKLDIRQIQRAPQQAQSLLSSLQNRINGPELAAERAQARELIRKYAT